MEKQWQAKWIVDQRFLEVVPINLFHKQLEKTEPIAHDPSLKNHHMLVRKTFRLDKKPSKAYLDISADDYYKLSINGNFVAQGPAPSYHFHYHYNRLDVHEFLKAGKNVIAVHVYYQGLVNRVWNSGDYRQGMIAELFTDGKLCFGTDSSWKYKRALEFKGTKTIGYETQFSEDIDERLKIKGWKDIHFEDAQWENAVENEEDDHELFLQLTPPVEVYEIKPKTVERIADGNYLIDFGQEITGQFKMTASGQAGEVIQIMCGEELEVDQRHVRYQLRCNCEYKDEWILSGDNDTLEQYDYKAFRYVEVVGAQEAINIESFCAVVRHYPMDEKKCQFHSSDVLLNGIWDICKNGVKYGAQEVYVDCPSREKGQYLGDLTVTAHAHLYLSGDLRLFKKGLKDFALSAVVCSGLMAVAPGGFMQEIADFSLLWPYQLLTYYQQSGDVAFLQEMYPVAEGIMTYFKKYQREDGLLENVKEKWNLVDWPDNLRDHYDFDLSEVVGDGCHNVINAFYCGAVKVVEEIGEILGVEKPKEFPQLREAFIKAFYREELKLFTDSNCSAHTALHSNIIALFYGLVPDAAKESVVAFIRTKRFCCGVYMSYFLLKGLANAGEYELIYELITSKEEQSWANMLSEGATTCFEAWGKGQKWNTSLCHPWASAPISVIIEDIVGLKPAKPGWEEISFTPHIPNSLEYLILEINTVKGKIRVEHKDKKQSIFTPVGLECKLD